MAKVGNIPNGRAVRRKLFKMMQNAAADFCDNCGKLSEDCTCKRKVRA